MSIKKYHVDLTEVEQNDLSNLIKSRSEKSAVVKRCYVLLAADRNGDKNWTDRQISETYGMRPRSIELIRKRFVEDGLPTVLNGKPRPYKEPILTGDVEARLIALRCGPPPKGHNKWTLHLLSEQMVALEHVESISHESVRQLLKKQHKALEGEKLGDPRANP
jgi:hypothetical protein